jgi:hypothetical protein
MVPGVASAALSVDFTPDLKVTKGAIPTGEQFFDLVFNETGAPTHEQLFAYDLYFRRDKAGLNIVRVDKPDNWVFTAPASAFSEDRGVPGTTPPEGDVVNAFGDIFGANVDVTSGTKAARVIYTIDPNIDLGVYHIMLDPSSGTTQFVSGETAEAFPVNITDMGTVTVVPEPASLSLLGVAGLLALRRRRSA